MEPEKVPAHAGGVDLSDVKQPELTMYRGPRPCGRGGFKLELNRHKAAVCRPRPCGRGGFKLNVPHNSCYTGIVPAHAGGVDLSLWPAP